MLLLLNLVYGFFFLFNLTAISVDPVISLVPVKCFLLLLLLTMLRLPLISLLLLPYCWSLYLVLLKVVLLDLALHLAPIPAAAAVRAVP